MTGQELLEKMDLVEPEYIEAADSKPAKKTHIWKKLGIAACFCLLFGTITAAATGAFGTRLIRSFTASPKSSDEEESGYELALLVDRKPINSFSEEIQSLKKTFIKQFKESVPWSSFYPGSYYQSFSTSAEACNYIGLPGLKSVEWEGMDDDCCSLSALGNEKGQLLQLSLENDYKVNNIRLQAFTHIYTEYCKPEDLTFGSYTTESIQFTEEFKTNKQGKQYQIIRSSAMESGFLGLEGYLVDNGILYSLNIAYLEEDAEQAEELLLQWANLF